MVVSSQAIHRMAAVLVVYHWDHCPGHTLGPTLLSALADTSSMEDMLPFILGMQKDCQVQWGERGGRGDGRGGRGEGGVKGGGM
jgi:hypothetical protein